MRKIKSIIERFESKIFYSPDGCWYWIASTRPDGYGQIMWDTAKHKPKKANRAAWELYNGEIPKGLHVCHTCDNRLCVNPDHLFLGTDLDNVRDMDQKGRRVCSPQYGEKHGCSKLKNEEVLSIRELKKNGRSTNDIAQMFNVSKGMVRYIVNRQFWKHI